MIFSSPFLSLYFSEQVFTLLFHYMIDNVEAKIEVVFVFIFVIFGCSVHLLTRINIWIGDYEFYGLLGC